MPVALHRDSTPQPLCHLGGCAEHGGTTGRLDAPLHHTSKVRRTPPPSPVRPSSSSHHLTVTVQVGSRAVVLLSRPGSQYLLSMRALVQGDEELRTHRLRAVDHHVS